MLNTNPAWYAQHTRGKLYSTSLAKALLTRALRLMRAATCGGGVRNSRKATYSDTKVRNFSLLKRINTSAASIRGMDRRCEGSCGEA